MRSAASRISARRLWPSPLALRAERRTGTVVTDKMSLPQRTRPYNPSCRRRCLLRDPNFPWVTSACYVSNTFGSGPPLDGRATIGESPLNERTGPQDRRNAQRNAHDGLGRLWADRFGRRAEAGTLRALPGRAAGAAVPVDPSPVPGRV